MNPIRRLEATPRLAASLELGEMKAGGSKRTFDSDMASRSKRMGINTAAADEGMGFSKLDGDASSSGGNRLAKQATARQSTVVMLDDKNDVGSFCRTCFLPAFIAILFVVLVTATICVMDPPGDRERDGASYPNGWPSNSTHALLAKNYLWAFNPNQGLLEPAFNGHVSTYTLLLSPRQLELAAATGNGGLTISAFAHPATRVMIDGQLAYHGKHGVVRDVRIQLAPPSSPTSSSSSPSLLSHTGEPSPSSLSSFPPLTVTVEHINTGKVLATYTVYVVLQNGQQNLNSAQQQHVFCQPGTQIECYTGAYFLPGVGACKRGLRTCNSEGSAHGACTGEVLPLNWEVCGDNIDNNCNGQVDEECVAEGEQSFSQHHEHESQL